MGTREGEQPGEDERLHQHLGIGISGEPDLHHARREQGRRGGRRRPAHEPGAEEEQAEHSEGREPAECVQRAGETVESIPDRDPHGVEMRELADHRAGRGVHDEEPHEAERVVGRVAVPRMEQLPERRGHRRDQRVVGDQCAALSDLDAFVDVDAGILAPDDVLGGRKEEHGAERDEGQRHERRERRARRRRHAQAAAVDGHEEHRQRGVCREQTPDRIAMRCREREARNRRPGDAEHDGPVDPLVCRQRGPPLAFEHGSAEDRRAGHEEDEQHAERGERHARGRAAAARS